MSAPPLDHDTILRAIQQWPRSERLALAQEILRSTVVEQPESDSTATDRRRASWKRLVGILATDQPAPSDEEIEQWRAERRMEKYGRQ